MSKGAHYALSCKEFFNKVWLASGDTYLRPLVGCFGFSRMFPTLVICQNFAQSHL
jgi:hypothetical protein